MTRDKLVKELKDVLSLRIKGGDFTDPNSRTIQLLVLGEVVSEVAFSVVQRREYEG